MFTKLNKKVLWIIGAACVVLFVLMYLLPTTIEEGGDVVECEQGLFETTVTTIGQIEATETIDITIPDALRDRRTRIWGIKIVDMVAEGTKVKKGDFVASLDPTEVDSELKSVLEQLDQLQNSFESACLDSSLRLSGYRDVILSAKDQLADKEIKVEQSKYESKAYQRQAQIEYEKALREVGKKERDLTRQRIRLEVGIRRIEDDIKFRNERLNKLKELKDGLKIFAPSDGMVIYGKNLWEGGRKFKIGDEVNRYNPNVASLPNLKSLVSQSFVQEVDIKHVKVGQKVKIKVDAFPEVLFTGKVLKMANIGQKIPGKQMNGFSVTIELDPFNEDLFPGMTSNNSIITGSWVDALYIPREALFGNDSLKFVYQKRGFSITKQIVVTGGENETYFRIVKGLNKGDRLLLNKPADISDIETNEL